MGFRASVIVSRLLQVIMLAKCVLAILEQNWYKQIGNYKKKMKSFRQALPSTRLHSSSFYIAGGTRKAAKRTEMKHARAK